MPSHSRRLQRRNLESSSWEYLNQEKTLRLTPHPTNIQAQNMLLRCCHATLYTFVSVHSTFAVSQRQCLTPVPEQPKSTSLLVAVLFCCQPLLMLRGTKVAHNDS